MSEIDEKELKRSALQLLIDNEETFEEAQARAAQEATFNDRIPRLKKDKNGDVNIRILPLHPECSIEGYKYKRTGYDVPYRQVFLNIAPVDANGKPKMDKNGAPVKAMVIPVIDARYVFPELKEKNIDVYEIFRRLALARCKETNNEELLKKFESNGYDGGLKWNSGRAMYCFNLDSMKDGVVMFDASYSQWKEIEERKSKNWADNIKYSLESGGDGKVPCPLTSPSKAYPLTITGKTEGKKTNYTFTLSDNDRKANKLTLEQAELLLSTTKLPEAVYVYNRYHLEATIVALTQMDVRYGLGIMGSDEMKEAISTVEALIPADDTRGFSFESKKGKGGDDDAKDEEVLTIDGLWDEFDALVDSGEGEKSEAGKELRAKVRQFNSESGTNIRITRDMTLKDALDKIDAALDEDGEDQDDEPAATPEVNEIPAPEPEPEDEPEEDEDDEAAGAPEPEPVRRSGRSARSERPGRR